MGNLVPRHSGHSEELSPSYRKRNDDIVKYGFWVIVVLIVSLMVLSRVISRSTRLLHRFVAIRSTEYSVPPEQSLSPESKTRFHSTALIRRITYPRVSFTQDWLRYLNPPSQGEACFLLAYWGLLSAGLWVNVIFKSPIKAYGIQWEVVGFRAAWVGTTQFPLLYATGCKYNIISLLTGISVQRLNWFHRWIACTIFAILGIHWTFFFQEWVLAGFVRQEIKTMSMVTWGFAAWTAIGIMVVSGFGWFRDKAFELWLVSHVILAWSVLALSYTHTHRTTYFVVVSLACLIYDLVARFYSALVHNLVQLRSQSMALRYGHQVRMEVLDDNYIRLNVKCPNFSWKAGQYVYLTVPSIQPFQSHPFTIINAQADEQENNDMFIIVKRHAGFTDHLHRKASEKTGTIVRCFLQGPHGVPPTIRKYDTIIFVSMGNRTSYCISLLQDIVQRGDAPLQILFYMIVADISMLKWYEPILKSCSEVCSGTGSVLEIRIYVTRPSVSNAGSLQSEADTLASDPFIGGRSSIESDRTIESSGTARKDVGNDLRRPREGISLSEDEGSWPEKRLSDDTPEDHAHLLAEKQYVSQPDRDSQVSTYTRMVLYGRPKADALLWEAIKRSGTVDRIFVVAAVSSPLAADLSNQVCSYIANAKRANHSGNIRLWIEQNG